MNRFCTSDIKLSWHDHNAVRVQTQATVNCKLKSSQKVIKNAINVDLISFSCMSFGGSVLQWNHPLSVMEYFYNLYKLTEKTCSV